MAHYIDELLGFIEKAAQAVDGVDRETESENIINQLLEAPFDLSKPMLAIATTNFISTKDPAFEADISAILKACNDDLIARDNVELDDITIEKIQNALLILEEIRMHFDLVSIQRIMMNGISNQVLEGVKPIVRHSKDLMRVFEQKSDELIEKQRLLDESQIKLQEKQDAIEKKQKDNQRDFVAVLGMFTTIIFAAFGGLQLLAEVFKGLNKTPLDVALIHGSFVFISLILILSLLFSGLSRMSNLPIRSCSCSENDKNCTCSFAAKHPTVFFSILLVVTVTSFAIIDKYFEFRKLLANGVTDDGVNWSNFSIMIQISMLCLIPSAILIIVNFIHKFTIIGYGKLTNK